jgi:adenylate kinase family enzyme
MFKLVIFGNSGSGKSTLARAESDARSCAHLDLDTIAWEEGHAAPTRRALEASGRLLDEFCARHTSWVIEGCYADLLELAMLRATEVIFLNPGVETCQANCRNRPWEPHKYPTAEAQQANLNMLLDWVAQYPHRDDEFSLQAHRRLFDGFSGTKQEYTSNARP